MCTSYTITHNRKDIRLLFIKKYIHTLVGALITIVCLTACQLDRSLLKNGQESQVHIIRYDRLVEDYVSSGNITLWQRMNTEFPRETRALIEDVLKLGHADQEGIEDSLRAYYNDPILVQLRKDVGKKYENLHHFEKELTNAFQRLEAEDSTFVIPKVYVQNSAFNQSIVVGDSLIGISLDKYMGTDYPAYNKYFYENQRVTMEPARMVQECVFFYLVQQYPYSKHFKEYSLKNVLIHRGKIAWIVAQSVNKAPIDIAAYQTATKTWYTTHQDEVLKELKRPEIWNSKDSTLINDIMMTSTKHPYFKDPHSRGVGLWIGINIIDNYMKHHPNVSLDSLLKKTEFKQEL